MDNKRIDEMYAEAQKLLAQAKEGLAAEGELTIKKQEEIDAWLNQADEIKARAKKLEAILEKEQAMAEEKAIDDLEREQKERERKSEKAGFGNFYEYMLAVKRARVNGQWDKRLDSLTVKDMSGEDGTGGGFLIPTIQETGVLAVRGEAAMIRPLARVVPMASRLVEFPAVNISGGSSGVSAFYGGVRVYHVGENTNATESQPTFRTVDLHAREIVGYCEVPNSLIRDTPISLEAFLQGPGSFGGALAWQEDYDFLRGDGSNKARGMLNAPCRVTVTRNTASDFKFVDAVTMKSRLLMSGGANKPVWIMAQTIMPKLYQMTDAASQNIWLPNAAGTGPETLLGYPIYWTEKTPALGTAGDAMLIDAGYYLVGDRQIVTMDVDTSYKFQAMQTAFRISEAVDGQPWLNTYITLADGSTTVSPFVVLS